MKLKTQTIIIAIVAILAYVKRKAILALFSGKPNWIVIAEAEKGQKEAVGGKHNARILEYHAATSGKASSDEVAWCSSFVNWVMEKAGKGKTGSALAVSWAKYGKKLEQPCYGCIAVMSYGNGFGHVGFVVGKKGAKLLFLGGNQSDTRTLSD